MKNKILNGIGYFFCVGLGFFTLILFIIPYLTVYSQTINNSSPIPIITNYYSVNQSGYQIMQMWDLGFGGVISSLLQIFILILSLLMIAWGVCGCLKVFGAFDSFPEKIGKVNSKTISSILLCLYLSLNILLLIFLIVVTATNVYTFNYTNTTETVGIKFSAGIFLTLIITATLVVAQFILNKKFSAIESPLEDVYICSNCGRKSNPNHKFCYKCGGEIVKQGAIEEILNDNKTDLMEDSIQKDIQESIKNDHIKIKKNKKLKDKN